MIDKAVITQVNKCVPVNERICYIRISKLKLDLIILNCYAPTENEDEETFDAFPKNCIRLIVGDLNAQFGRETFFRQTFGKESWHPTINYNCGTIS